MSLLQIHGQAWEWKAKRSTSKKLFAGYQVNAELMKYAKENAMVQHCLPAYRGQVKLQKKCLKPMQMKFLKKRKTVCMHKKP